MADATLKMTIDAGPAIKSIAEVQELIRSHAALRAEVESLRADAERYRWLRDVGDGNWRPMGIGSDDR